jgi:hypothetical protein
MESSIVKHLFFKLFGLKLARADARVIAFYGSISLAIREFLEHCGYAGRTPAFVSLAVGISSFVERSRARHGKREAQHEIRVALRHMGRCVTGAKALWIFTREVALRVYWAGGDLHDRLGLDVYRTRRHEKARHLALNLMRVTDLPSQMSTADMLASEMHLRSLRMLIDICAEVARPQQRVSKNTKSFDQHLEKAFPIAIESIENNIKRFLQENKYARRK